jgi:hypothetical protein
MMEVCGVLGPHSEGKTRNWEHRLDPGKVSCTQHGSNFRRFGKQTTPSCFRRRNRSCHVGLQDILSADGQFWPDVLTIVEFVPASPPQTFAVMHLLNPICLGLLKHSLMCSKIWQWGRSGTHELGLRLHIYWNPATRTVSYIGVLVHASATIAVLGSLSSLHV